MSNDLNQNRTKSFIKPPSLLSPLVRKQKKKNKALLFSVPPPPPPLLEEQISYLSLDEDDDILDILKLGLFYNNNCKIAVHTNT